MFSVGFCYCNSKIYLTTSHLKLYLDLSLIDVFIYTGPRVVFQITHSLNSGGSKHT